MYLRVQCTHIHTLTFTNMHFYAVLVVFFSHFRCRKKKKKNSYSLLHNFACMCNCNFSWFFACNICAIASVCFAFFILFCFRVLCVVFVNCTVVLCSLYFVLFFLFFFVESNNENNNNNNKKLLRLYTMTRVLRAQGLEILFLLKFFCLLKLQFWMQFK